MRTQNPHRQCRGDRTGLPYAPLAGTGNDDLYPGPGLGFAAWIARKSGRRELIRFGVVDCVAAYALLQSESGTFVAQVAACDLLTGSLDTQHLAGVAPESSCSSCESCLRRPRLKTAMLHEGTRGHRHTDPGTNHSCWPDADEAPEPRLAGPDCLGKHI